VIWYGIFDFVNHETAAGSLQERIGGVDNVTTLLGCDPKDCPAQALAASPIHYVGKGSPPMLLIHGMADTEVSFHQSERMAAAMRKAGASVETLFLSDINHGLIGKTPEATRTASLQGLERSFDFFDRMAHRAR
jgi:dipeptidyl aminopeptidase/acylaminoacyl peptidase